jgi:hypothetical protein
MRLTETTPGKVENLAFMVEPGTRFPKIYNPFKRTEDGKSIQTGVFSRDEFAALLDTPWTATEKMDGTNVRIVWDTENDVVSIFGRKANSQFHPDLLKRLQGIFAEPGRWHAAFEELIHADVMITLYGEGIGPGIQKGGGGYLPVKDFCLFDVRVGPLWLKQDDVTEIARKMALHRAPVYGIKTLKDWIRFVAWAKQDGTFISALPGASTDKLAEGLICRPQCNFLTRMGERVVCKIKRSQVPAPVDLYYLWG